MDIKKLRRVLAHMAPPETDARDIQDALLERWEAEGEAPPVGRKETARLKACGYGEAWSAFGHPGLNGYMLRPRTPEQKARDEAYAAERAAREAAQQAAMEAARAARAARAAAAVTEAQERAALLWATTWAAQEEWRYRPLRALAECAQATLQRLREDPELAARWVFPPRATARTMYGEWCVVDFMDRVWWPDGPDRALLEAKDPTEALMAAYRRAGET